MHLVLFDIDGTLVNSTEYDSEIFVKAVKNILNLTVSGDWLDYQHASDAGVIAEILEDAGIKNNSDLALQVEHYFCELIREHVATLSPEAHEVTGAKEFIDYLNAMDNVCVGYATGGWKKSALDKLASIHIFPDSHCMASANDHVVRTEIMKIAREKQHKMFESVSYFGDGIWDQIACQKLGYHFIAVGKNLEHQYQIQDFSDLSQIATLLPFSLNPVSAIAERLS